MKIRISLLFAVLFVTGTAGAVSVQPNDNTSARNGTTARASSDRGNAGLVNSYTANQRSNYYIVSTPDVDTACRNKIYKCLSDYCGDVTVVPGQRTGKCTYSTESELYNYALLCLQKDNETLLPTYSTSYKTTAKGMNTASRLCPSYVQQELMSYLSMANMASQLSKSNSSVCLQRRQELEAAMSCHSISLSYGNETANMLTSMLTDYCGDGVPGGSAEMVQRYATAGNVGANIWGWAEKVVNLDLSKKGSDWENAINAVLAGYTNRMNLACGENMQLNLTANSNSGSNEPTTLQTVASMAVGVAFPAEDDEPEAPTAKLYNEVKSMSEIYDFSTARQVVQAGLTNSVTTQNAFLSSAQMNSMQTAYKLGTKVFVIRDSARCYLVPVASLETYEQSVIAQTFASCVSQ